MNVMVLLLVVVAGSSGQVVSQKLKQDAAALRPNAIKSVARAVADWQLDHPVERKRTDWTHGAFFAGLCALADLPGCEGYLHVLRKFGQENQWQLGQRPYHADDHCVGQMYIRLYKAFKDPDMIAALRQRFDWILANPSDVTLQFGRQQGKDRWWWCDALFMAPAAWAGLAQVTGERRYLEFMDREWWATTDYLYDPNEHLYFRDDRFFFKREANGRKIFWSRGNGWVFAGLARVLELMPQDWPSRPRYVQLYKDMARTIVDLQQSDGLWRSSLLDTDAYPTKESSGSGFFCYGLAWGCNNRILGGDQRATVMRAWKGLLDCVHEDGKLGYVQPIGDSPNKVSADLTDLYGVGAFLLAASEVYRLAEGQEGS